jgi:LDH2 family malate/lactate/ureidoglycolate dehydrogenase
MADQLTVMPEKMTAYIKNLYLKAGLTEEDAAVCADCTVKTNLWGVDSHGVLRTTAYIERILKGAVKAEPDIKFLKGENGPLAVMDGGAGMGYVVGTRAIRAAITGAKQFGVGMVVVNNSNHFGAAALYARQAAEEGLLAMVTTNVIPNIGMPGNKKPVTGNNPIAMAAPIGMDYPFSLDISMSAVSGGKLLLAQKKGDKIPTTWAIDKDGNPTDDPFAGFAGILLPTGMHKGLGMSLFIDIITGVVSGGPFLQNIKSMYKHADDPSETSHMFMVFDPEFFLDRSEFEKRMGEWVKMIKDTPMTRDGVSQIIPGEIEYNCEQQRRKDGLPIPAELVKDLEALAEKLGISAKLF